MLFKVAQGGQKGQFAPDPRLAGPPNIARMYFSEIYSPLSKKGNMFGGFYYSGGATYCF